MIFECGSVRLQFERGVGEREICDIRFNVRWEREGS